MKSAFFWSILLASALPFSAHSAEAPFSLAKSQWTVESMRFDNLMLKGKCSVPRGTGGQGILSLRRNGAIDESYVYMDVKGDCSLDPSSDVVYSPYDGQGISTLLRGMIVNQTPENGGQDQLHLKLLQVFRARVKEDNKDALRFLESNGYSRVGTSFLAFRSFPTLLFEREEVSQEFELLCKAPTSTKNIVKNHMGGIFSQRMECSPVGSQSITVVLVEGSQK